MTVAVAWSLQAAVWLLAAGVLYAGEAGAQVLEEGRVIVKFRATTTTHDSTSNRAVAAANGRADESAATARIRGIGRRTGLALQQGRMVGTRMHVVKTRGLNSRALMTQLRQDPDVEYVVVDARRQILTVPNDPLYLPNGGAVPIGPASGQWYLHTPDSTTPASINAEAAWTIGTGSATGAIVAVIDTGVRYDHPDLGSTGSGGKLLPGAALLAAQSLRSADATDTGDWVSAGQCSSGSAAANSSWHGTQVAGLVGALSNNNAGMASVGWNVRVLPVRVLAQCGGYDSDIIAAMNWVVGDAVSGLTTLSPTIASEVKVINLSLGSNAACSAAYIDAINNVRSHGTVVVAAAGNSDGQAVGAPASCPGVIAVGGLRHVGTKVGYSSVGSEISLSAPGGNCVNATGLCLYPILTTSNTGATTAGTATYTDGLNASTGTSFAAPLVSGTAALMLQARPALQPDDVRRLLRDTARAFPQVGGVAACHAPNSSTQAECNCTTSTCGAGMLDAGQAVNAAANGAVPRITVTPSSPVNGQTITLDASGSQPSVTGSSIVSYAWVLVDGGGIVSALSGPTNTSSISVTPSAAGTFTVQLTVIDDSSPTPVSAVTTETVIVAAPTTARAAGSSGGGGGGGAMPVWPLLALTGVVATATRRSRLASRRTD
ncbi:S8 family serine peptidase [Aquabacterium sp.]|uniref:S8 family serine peptidase n=1 Tax=Aquabacterium sp. TaxID=1872578 RepID=UPI0035AFB2A1